MRAFRSPNPLIDVRRPQNGAVADLNPTGFQWQPIDGATAYELKLGSDQGLDSSETKTYRVEAGDPLDAFVTAQELPTDGSLDGRTLMIDEAGVLVQAFTIRHVTRRGAETLIHSADEPGMTISPNLIKLECFPCWGIVGQARFHIAGSTILRATGQRK